MAKAATWQAGKEAAPYMGLDSIAVKHG